MSSCSSMSAGSKCRALEFYSCIQVCHIFFISKCREESDLSLCTTLVLAYRTPLCISKFQPILRPNTFLNQKSPPRNGILFANTKIVHRLRSDSPLHVCESENYNASARRSLPQTFSDSSAGRRFVLSRLRLDYYRRVVSFPLKQI